jgi:hypothetical protein
LRPTQKFHTAIPGSCLTPLILLQTKQNVVLIRAGEKYVMVAGDPKQEGIRREFLMVWRLPVSAALTTRIYTIASSK